MKSTKKLLSVRALKKHFPIARKGLFQREALSVRANEDITFDIYEGETLGLVGESGCGKSTLGRVLLGLYEKTAGSILYYGRTLDELSPAYVERILKDAPKLIEAHDRFLKKAEEYARLCEAAGERAISRNEKRRRLAEESARAIFERYVKILGGFSVLDDCREGASALLDLHKARARVSALRAELSKIEAKIERFSSCSFPPSSSSDGSAFRRDEKVKGRIAKRLEGYRAKKLSIEAALTGAIKVEEGFALRVDALRKKHCDDPAFASHEALLDDGIDLSLLTHSEMRYLRRDLQIVFQDPYSSLNPRMTVGQIIGEGLVTHGYFERGSREMQAYILDVMRRSGLQDYMIHRYPHQFSGGQRQRISIARALAVKPKFLLCDECVSALDVSIQSQIINLLCELKEKENLTYLFISHDLSVVRYISDRIGVMYLGNIVELGDTDAIFTDPRHPYTVALLSAIPTIDAPDLQRERIILKGALPSPIKPPSGCKFHTRCFMACDACKSIQPPMVEVSPGHFVACHKPERKVDEKGRLVASSGEV